jgi:adenylate cyclase
LQAPRPCGQILGRERREGVRREDGIVEVRIGDYEVPTEADGQMWIRSPNRPRNAICRPESAERGYRQGRYRRPSRHHRHERAGLLDLRATPLEASVPASSCACGIEQIL